MFGSPGVIEMETKKVEPNQCELKREPDVRYESCIQRKLLLPPPRYDVRAGRSWFFPEKGAQQCQIYAQAILDQCSFENPRK